MNTLASLHQTLFILIPCCLPCGTLLSFATPSLINSKNGCLMCSIPGTLVFFTHCHLCPRCTSLRSRQRSRINTDTAMDQTCFCLEYLAQERVRSFRLFKTCSVGTCGRKSRTTSSQLWWGRSPLGLLTSLMLNNY